MITDTLSNGTRTWIGFILVAIAQLGLLITTALSYSFFGMAFAPFSVVAILSLVLSNIGLAALYLSFRSFKESSRRMRLLAEMNVQVNREILLNPSLQPYVINDGFHRESNC